MAKQEKAGNTPARLDAQKNLASLEKNIADNVLGRVRQLMALKAIRLPADYAEENALKTAWLVLLETKTKDGKPVLEVCTLPSIQNALFKMTILGLNPIKKQCDFIAYGNKLITQIEYHGNIALAKRFGGVKDVVGNIIYEGDVFKYEIDPLTGNRMITEHSQEFENIDLSKIKGAYATLTFVEEGKQPYIEVMNKFQITQAWNQGPMKGNSPAHKNFPDEMSKKSVINRACKLFITSSDDGALFSDDEKGDDEAKMASQRTVYENSNKEEISMSDEYIDAEEVNDELTPEPQPETEKKPVVTKTSNSGAQTQMEMGLGDSGKTNVELDKDGNPF